MTEVGREENIKERELRQRLLDVERKHEQMVVQDLNHAGELKIMVQRLAQIFKEM